MKFSLIIVCILSTAWAEDENNIYCDIVLCHETEHIACDDNDFGDACPLKRESFDMNPVKHILIHHMNLYRQHVAMGRVYTIRNLQALRMIKIQWDDELAHVASFNVKRCVSGYDKCHNTHRFRDSGQVIHSEYLPPNFNMTVRVIHAIDTWFGSNVYCSQDIIKNYELPSLGFRSHKPFTMLVSDRNTHVGCSAVKTEYPDFGMFYMCCNFAYKNIIGEPVFDVGPTANGCINGIDTEFPGLCVEDKSIDASPLAGCGVEDEKEHDINLANRNNYFSTWSYTIYTTIFFKFLFGI